MADPQTDQSAQHRTAHNVVNTAARRLQDGKLSDRDALLQCSPRKRLSPDSVQLLDSSTRSSKRLRPNTHLNMQVGSALPTPFEFHSTQSSERSPGLLCNLSGQQSSCIDWERLCTGATTFRPFGRRPFCTDGFTKPPSGRQSAPTDAAWQQQHCQKHGALANPKYCRFGGINTLHGLGQNHALLQVLLNHLKNTSSKHTRRLDYQKQRGPMARQMISLTHQIKDRINLQMMIQPVKTS